MAVIIDGTIGITTPGGSAAAPSLVGATGGATTGVWFPAASTFAFATGGTERARFDSSGYLLVGTTTTVGGVNNQISIKAADIANIGYGLGIQNATNNTGGRFINFVNSSGTTNGYISQTSSSVISYVTSSDVRLKENIKDADTSLNVLSTIAVRKFNWIEDKKNVAFGFVAQELETVFPDAVSKGNTETEIWGVDNSKLVPMLVKSIQELKVIVDTQAARITALEAA